MGTGFGSAVPTCVGRPPVGVGCRGRSGCDVSCERGSRRGICGSYGEGNALRIDRGQASKLAMPTEVLVLTAVHDVEVRQLRRAASSRGGSRTCVVGPTNQVHGEGSWAGRSGREAMQGGGDAR